MKRFLLLLGFCLGLGIADAQLTAVYVNDGYVLTNNQWHFDDYSVVEANNGYFLVISPRNYYYSYLGTFNHAVFTHCTGDYARAYRPYIYGSNFGWYVQACYADYFMYPYNGYYNVIRIYTPPVYYNYYYALRGVHYIDMYHWHFARPHHHRPIAPPPYAHRPPLPPHHGSHNPPPPHGHGNHHVVRPTQSNGVSVRSQGGTGSSTYRVPNSGSSVRTPAGNTPRSSGATYRQPQGSSRSTGTTVRQPQGNRSSGNVSRPSGGNRSSGVTTRSPQGGSRSGGSQQGSGRRR